MTLCRLEDFKLNLHEILANSGLVTAGAFTGVGAVASVDGCFGVEGLFPGGC